MRSILLFTLVIWPTFGLSQTLEQFKHHVIYLSSDELRGRAPGSAGSKQAADYIVEHFKEIGLSSYKNGSYLQTVYAKKNDIEGSNVIGWIPAAQETSASLIFMAHYDGLGSQTVTDANQDGVFNGARDNATGVAALIELARQYKRKQAPAQNIVFIATTMEEMNLEGSIQYVKEPLFPLDNISICLNLDGVNVAGLRSDFFVMPRQGVNVIDDIVQVAGQSGWLYEPPPWIDGMNSKFDTVAFLSKGVPALTLWAGNKLKDGSQAPQLKFGDIHSEADEVNENWNWQGVEEHLQLYTHVANYYLVNSQAAQVTEPALFRTEQQK